MFDCPNLAVPPHVMQHVVNVESSRNPFAIGVVGGRLARQPRTLGEAVATAKMLEQNGYNFSLGIAQVNRYNLAKYGLSSYQQAFEICPNLQAGARILRECYDRAQDWGKAFSCYYSGNFVTGYRHGYVQKIFASMRQGQASVTQMASSIPVYSNANRRRVPVQSFPSYGVQPAVSSVAAQALPSDGDTPQMLDPRYLEDPRPAGSSVSPVVVADVIKPNQRATDSDNINDTAYVIGRIESDNRGKDSAFVY